MKLDKSGIKERVLLCFSKEKPDDQSLSLFVDELFDELRGVAVLKGFDNKATQVDISNLGFSKSLEVLGNRLKEKDFLYKENSETLLKKLEAFQKAYFKLKDKLSDDIRPFLNNAALDYHLKRGELVENENQSKSIYRWTRSLYEYDPDDGIIPFEEIVRRFEEGLEVLQEVLMLELLSHKKEPGRPKKLNSYDLYLAKMCALSECLLGLEIKITRNEADSFYSLILVCLRLAQNRDGDASLKSISLKREIEPCFSNADIIESMGRYYHQYDRLDLYIEHVKRSNQAEWIADRFENEWADWGKPDNYQSLISMTKTA
jgi:hypothetical protein